jgi:hypothetical protein
MAHSDAIGTLLKFLPATRNLFFGLGAAFVALLFVVRATQNPDALGQTLDEVIGGLAGIFGVWRILRGTWTALVILQQDRAPKAFQHHLPPPNAKFEDHDDAIRRMSGKSTKK